MADNDYLNPLSTKLDADQTIRRAYDAAKNRHRVDAEVTATIGTVDVIIDADSGDNIALKDPASGNELAINSDGSINVITAASPQGNLKLLQNSVNGIASGVTTTLIQYNASQGDSLQFASVSGTNVSTFELFINNSLVMRKRSSFAQFNVDFNLLITSSNGYKLDLGDLVEMVAYHQRPDLGDFDCTLSILGA